MKEYKEAIEMRENENGKYDIYNFARKPVKVVDDNGNVIRESYCVAFNFSKEMAQKEVERMNNNLIRINGTTKVLNEN